MADLAEHLPDESRAQANAKLELDAKLRAAADRAAKLRESKGRAMPVTLAQSVEAKYRALAAPTPVPGQPSERMLRIAPDEGDPPTVSAIFRDGMVPARFSSVTLDSYQPVTRSQTSALAAVRYWVERALVGEGCMVALIGPQGTGKSHLLYAAANALLDAGKSHGFYARPWYRLADELRYGGEHPVTKREMESADVRRDLWTKRTVLLDEVRPTAATAFDDTELTKFACHAYDSRYPMLITSNVNPLADVMGAPAASRFTQIVIDGPDRRQA